MERQIGQKPTYFFGCDMGGWQSTNDKKGDALAVCKWCGDKLDHVMATAEIQFFPIEVSGILGQIVDRVLIEGARVIVAIDAALGWPVEFSRLVQQAPECIEYDTRSFKNAIVNPYLYRATERFIKEHVRKDKDPLTAPGDKFGNNSSKAQMLAAWFRSRFPMAYRPPFCAWSNDTALRSDYTIIEVYPDASLRCEAFKNVPWPAYEQEAKSLRNKDIADAKVCALTAICYAMQVGLIPKSGSYPCVYLPNDPLVRSLEDKAIYKDGVEKAISVEGWIFAPYVNPRK